MGYFGYLVNRQLRAKSESCLVALHSGLHLFLIMPVLTNALSYRSTSASTNSGGIT